MDLRQMQEIELIGLDGYEGKNTFRSWNLEVWVRDLSLRDINANLKKEHFGDLFT